jgi:hypothetical protein
MFALNQHFLLLLLATFCYYKAMRKNQTTKGRPRKRDNEKAVKVSASLKPEIYAWLRRVMQQKDCSFSRALHESLKPQFILRNHKEFIN